MTNVPIINAQVGKPLPILEIVELIGFASSNEIKEILERQIKEHSTLYGTEPYRLEYSRSLDGYQLRPNSVVGRIDCTLFILQISSKFEEIEIGKWLQIAHYSGATSLVRHNNDIAETSISEKDNLKGVDYFILSFISSVYDCINQGLIYENSKFSGDDPNFNGKLNVTKFVQKGANPSRLQTDQILKSYNCNPNQIISFALKKCILNSSNLKLRGLANGLLPYFKNVDKSVFDPEIIDYNFVSVLPRPDYKKALALCKVIIEGFSATEGDTNSFLPFFTINLDTLFENFVSHDLKNTLKDDLYIVKSQDKIGHPIQPELQGNFISPDLIVKPKGNQGKNVVIDTKNKYSQIDSSGRAKISNQDLFQMVYYCQTVGSDIAILVYPGDGDNFTRYPLLGSEGKPKHKIKRDNAITSIFNDGRSGFVFETPQLTIRIIAWRLNLSGSLFDTRHSVAQLSQFVADCVQKEIL